VSRGKKTRYTAEFASVVYALKVVEKRWRSLNEYIGGLLTEDFMDPTAFTKLLFDDEDFSRSKLYFWATGCLNEFEASIEDNILQWKLFRMARMARPNVKHPEGGGISSESNTRNPFIITACLVGLVTFIVVFNLGNIAGLVGEVYHRHRTRLLEKMGNDSNEGWRNRRDQFGEYNPNVERKGSEWVIIGYQIWRGLRWKRSKATRDGVC
jgi:hypothetical protein